MKSRLSQTAKKRAARSVALDAAQYRKMFALFVSSTDQKRRQIEQIRAILKTLKTKKDFLDVGAGSGEITCVISEEFTRTSVVEPNTEQVTYLSERYPDFRIFPDDIRELNLGDEQFDFILCSHVLYYIPEAEWMPVAESLTRHLRPGGRFLIVLQSPSGGVSELFRKFGVPIAPSIELWNRLTRRFGVEAVRAYYGTCEIRTETLEQMTAIGIFLMSARNIRPRRSALSRYLECTHRVPEGYRIGQEYLTFEIEKK
jgi:SAM-dependent methyltransferase